MRRLENGQYNLRHIEVTTRIKKHIREQNGGQGS